jgi:hypothetical protein
VREVIHSLKSEDGSEELLAFHCPPCGYTHPFRIKGAGPTWTWNGSMERPTFDPSLRIMDPQKPCHLNLVDGQIKYHGDCWHELKGTSIPCPVWSD